MDQIYIHQYDLIPEMRAPISLGSRCLAQDLASSNVNIARYVLETSHGFKAVNGRIHVLRFRSIILSSWLMVEIAIIFRV